MDKYQNKYRIPSARATWWNYANNGLYFITICTAGREHYFGEIITHKMQLTPIGEIALQCWLDIPDHFPFVKLDVFVVMPNHVHGILEIDKSDTNGNTDVIVETQNFASQPQKPPPPKNKFGPQSQNLASIIRGYKIGVKKYATINRIDFVWQSRFHDHIIRNDEEYNRISNYIVENPNNWEQDKFFKNE